MRTRAAQSFLCRMARPVQRLSVRCSVRGDWKGSTYALVDSVHTEILIQFFASDAVALASRRFMTGQAIRVLQALLKLGGAKIGEWKTDDDDHTCQFIREVEAFGQLCAYDRE